MTSYIFPNAINGDTFDGVRFSVGVNGSPLDLTGGSVVMTLTANGTPHIFSTQNGKMSIINPSGSGIVEFNKQIIDLYTYGTFDYEIVFRLADGTVKTYVNGSWTITR